VAGKILSLFKPFNRFLLNAFLTLAILGTAAAIGAALMIYLGVYNMAAVAQHTLPVYTVLDFALHQSIRQRAKHIDPPPLSDESLVERGFVLFHSRCVFCHGAPGIAPGDAGKGMLPHPTNLVESARELRAGEIFWVISNGIKMTGMPAWQFRFRDDDLWAIVAFVKRLPALSPEDYRLLVHTLADRTPEPAKKRKEARDPDPARGKVALQQHACTGCHLIPGVVGANSLVGPPLKGMARRVYIAGSLPNTPENLIRWIHNPQQISPGSAMPDLGVTEQDARDIAAYLYTLE